MIIILTQCFPSRIGGIESLMYNLSLGLSNYSKVLVLADGYDLKKDYENDILIKDSITIKRVRGLKFFRKRKKIKLLKSISNIENISCVVGDSWKSFELSIDFLNLNKIPTICLAHGNELIEKNKKQFQRLYNTLNKVSSIVCNSDFTKNMVDKVGVKTPIIKRIYPGAEDTRLLNEKNIPYINGNPILLTLSRLEKRKGHANVINVISKLQKYFPKIQYIIAGSGNELKNLKQLVKELKLENNVIFLGNVNNQEKKFLFKRASLMIMPTINEMSNRSIEGFGISYLEAAFYKVPSIASSIGGTSEAVLDNKTGIVINNIEDLYEKIKLLLNDNALLSNLGNSAYERVTKEFTWSNIVKDYLALINQINTN
tara:strand:+ start:188 stop:1300 length:1113 start_codon:yes stop_codon:yes gene_type:complete